MAGLEELHPPGEVFNYNTGETNMAGAVLRAAIGNNLSTYLEHKIWAPFGMEADANWLLHEPGGGGTGRLLHQRDAPGLRPDLASSR